MKTFTLVVLILGSFIGAGFCSGREVCTFFLGYGTSAYILVLVFSVFLMFAMRIFILAGKDNITIITSPICLASTFIMISSMLAGTITLGGNNIILKLTFYSATIIITIIACVGGITKVSRFNIVFVPIIVVMLLVVYVMSGGNSILTINYNGGVLNCINYLCFNMLTMGMFLLNIGRHYSRREITIASVISSIIICVLMLIMTRAVLNNFSIYYFDMPTLNLAYIISPVLYYLVKMTIWFALITTLITSTYAIVENLPNFSQNKLICIVVVLGICSMVSVIGFYNIVKYLYPTLGILGIIFTIDVLYSYKKQGH